MKMTIVLRDFSVKIRSRLKELVSIDISQSSSVTFLSYGRLFSAFPFVQDTSSGRMEITKRSSAAHRRWMGAIALYCTAVLVTTLNYYAGGHYRNISIHKFRSIATFTGIHLPWLYGPIILHTVWKTQEIKTYVNAAHSFHQNFQSKLSN